MCTGVLYDDMLCVDNAGPVLRDDAENMIWKNQTQTHQITRMLNPELTMTLRL